MTDNTFALMRSLNAAPSDTPIDMSNAAHLREQILRAPRPITAPRLHPRGFLRNVRQRVVAGSVAAGIAATATIAGFGISGSAPAYADWTAAPQPLSVHDIHIADHACTPKLADLENTTPATGEPAGKAPLKLSERRGDYVLLEYATPGLSKVETCLVTLPENGTKATTVDVASGGGGISTARARTINTVSEETMGDPQLALATGVVGQGVRAVTVHSGQRTVQASVKNGVFTAVWPGTYTKKVDGTLVNILTYDITLSDGAVIKSVPARG